MKWFADLESVFRTAVLDIQKEMTSEQVKGIHSFTVELSCEGRVDSELKISYRVGTNYDSSVQAATLQAALFEALRRKGWQDANFPKMISHVTGKEIKDECA